MDLQAVKATRRDDTGKGVARKLRKEGLAPAICYGLGKEPVNLTLSPHDILHAIRGKHGRNTVFSLQIGGEETPRMVILKDLQVHPLKRRILHVDFYEVTSETELHIDVPIKIIGRPIGEKLGGEAQWTLRALPVVCRPGFIPTEIEVDITALDLNDILFLEDLTFPDGVESAITGHVAIVAVRAGREEEEEEVEEAEGDEAEGEETPETESSEG